MSETHELCFIYINIETNSSRYLLQAMRQGFYMVRLTWKKRLIFRVDCVCYNFCRSIKIRSMFSRHCVNKYGANVSPRKTSPTISKKYVSTKWANDCFHVFRRHHYSCRFPFGREHVNSIFSILPPCMEWNALEKMKKQQCCLEIVCTYSFNNATQSKNLWNCRSISLKNHSGFSLEFSQF